MGSAISAPVNEAANFLNRVAPSQMPSLREHYPEIAEELQPGIMAGEEADEGQRRTVLVARGHVMLAALGEARRLCDAALPKAAARMQRGSRIRVGGQIVTTIASSAVLGSLSATETKLAAISGTLALIASIATIGADYIERVVDPGRGNVASIYLELVDARYRASSLYDTLNIQLTHDDIGSALEKTISEGNVLCETVNRSVYQIIEGVLSKAELLRLQEQGTLETSSKELISMKSAPGAALNAS